MSLIYFAAGENSLLICVSKREDVNSGPAVMGKQRSRQLLLTGASHFHMDVKEEHTHVTLGASEALLE